MRASTRTSALSLVAVVLMAACENVTEPPTRMAPPVVHDIVPVSIASWPGVYDPFTVLSLYIDMSGSDWDKIRRDGTNSIEVPAQFHAEGETPVAVTVRRKS